MTAYKNWLAWKVKTVKSYQEAYNECDDRLSQLYLELLLLIKQPSLFSIIEFELNEGPFWYKLCVKKWEWDKLFIIYGESILHSYFYRNIPSEIETKEKIDRILKERFCKCKNCDRELVVNF